MDYSRILVFLSFSWSFLILSTHQLQPSHTQVLLQLRNLLEHPKQLDYWPNHGVDLCYLPSPQVNITCQDNSVIEIRILGNNQTTDISRFNGYPSPDQKTLSQNFSMDSLVATLARINTLRVLGLVSMGIWGPIPDKIHRLESLECLDLSWNFLYGSIPQAFSRIGRLQVLKLDGNLLNGTLPDWFNSFSNLTSLSLSNNRLHGPLPPSLQEIPSLTEINLSSNGISGKFLDFRGLAGLRILDLSNNRLDSKLSSMPKGVITVLLSNNSFTGRIPDQFGQLNQLQQLDLSFNVLEGSPSGTLFALPNITSLNLASNMLTGSLPVHLSCGSKLGLVDISNNRLRGPLPSCLSSFKENRAIMFSGNCLSGDLGHQHPETYCADNPKEEKKSKWKNVKILATIISVVAVILAFLAFGFLLFCRQYCPRGTSEQHLLHKPPVPEGSMTRVNAETAKSDSQGLPSHRLFTLDELRASTNNFDKSTLMGENSTGKMYKGRLEHGSNIAIRCLTVSKRSTIRNLKLRLDLLSKLRHPHLVCLLGHCIDSRGKDESGANKVYLIYEYIPSGNYRDHLSETSAEKAFKWSDRLAILIGIAKAVHFLHTGIIPGFFSNRLKVNNILINEYGIGKLSDYGLSIIAQDIDKDKQEDGSQSWQNKSLEDDIYSFGLILQESIMEPSLCTRKELFLLNERERAYSGIPDGKIDPIVLASSSRESLSNVISLTTNCISPESSTQPTFEDIIWCLQKAAQLQATSMATR